MESLFSCLGGLSRRRAWGETGRAGTIFLKTHWYRRVFLQAIPLISFDVTRLVLPTAEAVRCGQLSATLRGAVRA